LQWSYHPTRLQIRIRLLLEVLLLLQEKSSEDAGRRSFTDVTVAPAAIVTTSSPKSMDTAKYPGGAVGAVAQAKVPVQDKFTMVKGPLSNYQI
jgi:hypothetical protein